MCGETQTARPATFSGLALLKWATCLMGDSAHPELRHPRVSDRIGEAFFRPRQSDNLINRV
jgi:hypothetical protein